MKESSAPLLTPVEYDTVIRQFNATAAIFPEDGTIHGCFEAQVNLTPQGIALISEHERLTYAQLNRRANQVAHALLARSLQLQDCVGIYAERSVEMIVGMLAVLKAGGAYVPLDPSYPPERLTFISKDSTLVAVLTTTGLAWRLPIPNVSVILLDQDLAQADENPCLPKLDSRMLAYVIYTSGSTGWPKGVLIEHRGVLRLVVNASYAQIRADDCLAHCASPSFDAATWEVWAALLNGARVCIVPQRAVLSPAMFCRMLVEHSVTAMFLTVGLFNEYVDALEQAFAGMRHLLVGGDKLSPSIVARALSKANRPQRFLNAYGPTETTTFATSFEISGEISADVDLPVGKPISNTQIYILDENRSPVPIGAVGEIFIGGPGVARGYLNRPELNAERFVPDTFSNSSGELLYRSGDMGSWRSDGNVEFMGRLDYQLKIRGFRIELGEIEMTLQRHPGVKQAVAIAPEDEGGLRHLIAYVTAAASDSTDELITHLREYLTQTVPRHLVPATIVVLDKFPLTSNGKLDRGALPTPDPYQEMKRADESAQTPLEKALTEIWEQVLKQGPVRINDNFFELGGDSIMGLDVIAQISERLKLEELSVIDLYEHPTAQEMAQFVEMLN